MAKIASITLGNHRRAFTLDELDEIFDGFFYTRVSRLAR